MSTKLTPNFTLEELTRSSTAERLGMPNWPEADDLRRLRGTAEMLQRIRDTLGHPIIVTSAYRAPAVNRAVGGVTSSDHVKGQAADILVPGYGTPYQVAKALAPLVSVLGIGQLILEGFKNGNPGDNRISNLREATSMTNAQNRVRPSKNNAAGNLGIYAQGGKWRASITCSGKSLSLGSFATEEDAQSAYLRAK